MKEGEKIRRKGEKRKTEVRKEKKETRSKTYEAHRRRKRKEKKERMERIELEKKKKEELRRKEIESKKNAKNVGNIGEIVQDGWVALTVMSSGYVLNVSTFQISWRSMKRNAIRYPNLEDNIIKVIYFNKFHKIEN